MSQTFGQCSPTICQIFEIMTTYIVQTFGYYFLYVWFKCLENITNSWEMSDRMFGKHWIYTFVKGVANISKIVSKVSDKWLQHFPRWLVPIWLAKTKLLQSQTFGWRLSQCCCVDTENVGNTHNAIHTWYYCSSCININIFIYLFHMIESSTLML